MGGADNTQPVHRINMPVAGYGGQSSGTAREGGPGPWLSARPPLNSAPSSSQEKNQRATHLTGAFLAFFVGILYFWLQLFLSWRMKNLPQPGAPWIGPLRLVLCSACFILEVASILRWSGGGSPMGWVCPPPSWAPLPSSASVSMQHYRGLSVSPGSGGVLPGLESHHLNELAGGGGGVGRVGWRTPLLS